MRTRHYFLFTLLVGGLAGFAVNAQAEIFVSQKKNSGSSSSSSSGGSGSIYVKPQTSGSSSKRDGSSDATPSIYNKTDTKIRTYAPGGGVAQPKTPYSEDPREAARQKNIEAAKQLSERTSRGVQRRMEEVRAARQQKLDERQKAWEAEQAKKAAAEQLREAKAAGPNGSSSSSSSANTPEPPAGVTTTRQVYNGGTSGRNASGGRIFNAR